MCDTGPSPVIYHPLPDYMLTSGPEFEEEARLASDSAQVPGADAVNGHLMASLIGKGPLLLGIYQTPRLQWPQGAIPDHGHVI